MHVHAGDYDLNYQYPVGAPTLVPAVGLEHALDFRRVPLGAGKIASSGLPPCALHIHGFHLEELKDLLDELRGKIVNYDLCVTTDCLGKKELIESLLGHHQVGKSAGSWRVLVGAGPGRNVGALFIDAYEWLSGYECALHVHTKRSVHTELSEAWRESLNANLIGSADLIHQIRSSFLADDRLGLLMPQTCAPMRQCLNWGANFSLAQVIWQRLNGDLALRVDAPLVFPVGMMFWFRPRALQQLSNLCRELQPLPLEPLPLDGTILHALERLVAHACEAAGFHWRLICGESAGRGADGHDDDPAVSLSVLRGQPEAYMQACALLADRTRRLEAETTYAGTALERSEERLLQLERQVAELEQRLARRRSPRLPGLGSLTRRIRQQRSG